MRRLGFLLASFAALTLALLVAGAARATWSLALLGFQLPALWTLLALVGIWRSSRSGQRVPVGFYLALGGSLACFVYFAFAVPFTIGGRPT